jgi:hypothetical protein
MPALLLIPSRVFIPTSRVLILTLLRELSGEGEPVDVGLLDGLDQVVDHHGRDQSGEGEDPVVVD